MINDFLILRPFNALFFLIFAVLVLVLAAVSFYLKNKSDSVKVAVLVTASCLTLVGFVIYKYFLSIDADYNILRQEMGGFNWWGELPLQLCNINMLLIPLALLTDKRGLKAFCFFVGPLGAFMALSMPTTGFSDVSILLPRMLGYYSTHFFIMFEGLAIATFGLYRPKFSDFPRIVVTLFIISFSVFMVNMVMRWSGVFANANYFYSVETEGNAILDFFHSILPYPFLYLIPCILILMAYMSIVTLGFELADKIRRAKD